MKGGYTQHNTHTQTHEHTQHKHTTKNGGITVLKIKLQQITEKLNEELDPYDRLSVYDLNDDHISEIVKDIMIDYIIHTYHADSVQLHLDIMDVMYTILATGSCRVRYDVSLDGNITYDYIIFTF